MSESRESESPRQMQHGPESPKALLIDFGRRCRLRLTSFHIYFG